MFIEMVASSFSSLNAQVIEKELKKTLPKYADCAFSVRKNHVDLNFSLWKKNWHCAATWVGLRIRIMLQLQENIHVQEIHGYQHHG